MESDSTYVGRFDGIPGLVWYADVRKVRGDELKIGDWLDSLDHRGARCIWGIWAGDLQVAELTPTRLLDVDFGSPFRTVMFGATDTEVIRVDVEYDVVDPDSQVQPDGSPL